MSRKDLNPFYSQTALRLPLKLRELFVGDADMKVGTDDCALKKPCFSQGVAPLFLPLNTVFFLPNNKPLLQRVYLEISTLSVFGAALLSLCSEVIECKLSITSNSTIKACKFSVKTFASCEFTSSC